MGRNNSKSYMTLGHLLRTSISRHILQPLRYLWVDSHSKMGHSIHPTATEYIYYSFPMLEISQQNNGIYVKYRHYFTIRMHDPWWSYLFPIDHEWGPRSWNPALHTLSPEMGCFCFSEPRSEKSRRRKGVHSRTVLWRFINLCHVTKVFERSSLCNKWYPTTNGWKTIAWPAQKQAVISSVYRVCIDARWKLLQAAFFDHCF